MAKSDTTLEQVRSKLETVTKELGLLMADTSGFIKVQGPTNKHRIYVQKSKHLNRIDATLPTQDAEGNDVPGVLKLSQPNGSITCNLEPTLENLEFHLRRLTDASLGTQVPNKPRPFAATPKPAGRRPKAVAMPVPTEALQEETFSDDAGPTRLGLESRLKELKNRSRLAKIRRILENPEEYGAMSEVEAAAIVDGKVKQEDMDEASSNAEATDLHETLSEAGVEVHA